MAVRRVDPSEAAELLEQGWIYVDVRSIPEFEQGHPRGAYNCPFMHSNPGRPMTPNPEFAAVFAASFQPDDQIILGCRSGQRSLRAAESLVAHGYTALLDMRGGWGGERGPGGRVTCDGWEELGLPSATEASPGRTYADLLAKLGR